MPKEPPKTPDCDDKRHPYIRTGTPGSRGVWARDVVYCKPETAITPRGLASSSEEDLGKNFSCFQLSKIERDAEKELRMHGEGLTVDEQVDRTHKLDDLVEKIRSARRGKCLKTHG